MPRRWQPQELNMNLIEGTDVATPPTSLSGSLAAHQQGSWLSGWCSASFSVTLSLVREMDFLLRNGRLSLGRRSTIGGFDEEVTLDFALTKCKDPVVISRQAVSMTMTMTLAPAAGHRWQNLPRDQRERAFVLSVSGSQAQQDEFERHVQAHVQFGQEIWTSTDAALDILTDDEIQSEGEDCSICSQPMRAPGQMRSWFEEDDTHVVVRTRCGHCFHESCVRKWLRDNSTCPLCRAHVL